MHPDPHDDDRGGSRGQPARRGALAASGSAVRVRAGAGPTSSASAARAAAHASRTPEPAPRGGACSTRRDGRNPFARRARVACDRSRGSLDYMGMETVEKTDAEWREELTPEQYQVLRQAGTERAFTGKYCDNHDDGAYRAPAAARSCSTATPSSSPAPAGRASPSRRWPRRSSQATPTA